jgi:hypothetical protein
MLFWRVDRDLLHGRSAARCNCRAISPVSSAFKLLPRLINTFSDGGPLAGGQDEFNHTHVRQIVRPKRPEVFHPRRQYG